ncbi:DUF1841 family protein [Uliginosibacterium sp. H1]|uniref:DUF1841 family protein n=1 Tax=Uliginosibacterium sp. H1 TaxID=3114757 RepID=UPI002E1855C8|nr:DUF1841 family protein [Uliginosibacterium sp. H1]
MYNPSRDQARAFFADAWRKYNDKTPLTPMEDIGVRIVLLHPEYHALLADEDSLHRDFSPEDGQINPFLHLSLHLAIEEQLSIDQPPGIRAAFEMAIQRHGGEQHDALHDVLECLGETIWKAQREGKPLDAVTYVECVRRRSQQA